MSQESKERLNTIKKNYEQIQEGAKKASEEVRKLGDKELSTKIEKVQKEASEVVEHIKKNNG